MSPGARQGWLIATGAMLALCLFAIWQSYLLPLSDKLGPGPGFFPFWLSILGAAFSLALLIGLVRTPAIEDPDAEPILPEAYGARRIAAIVGGLAATTLLMELVGFQIAMLLFNAGLVVALGERRWIVVAIFAVAGSFGVHYVFTTWLDVQLPNGLLGT
ncbi:MAG: tripartite tricarboxylate transporter TctB family protein [Alphaproteobacteria bacterium]|nr:tripartite tricarboxylate transporter TctB family protein [Alphaproteobacteria bacterium]